VVDDAQPAPDPRTGAAAAASPDPESSSAAPLGPGPWDSAAQDPEPRSRPAADPDRELPGLVAAYLDSADPADLASLVPPGGAAAAAAHAELAERRAPAETLLRVRPAGTPPAATVVEIVTDDMPFLVDSVTAALAGARATARVLLHPRPVVARDAAGVLVAIGDPVTPPVAPPGGRVARESWIRVQSRPLEPAARDALAAGLATVLADVQVTDEDAPAMRDRALALADELEQAPPVGIDPDETTEAAALLRWLADEYWTFIGYREYRLDDRAGGDHDGDHDGDPDGDHGDHGGDPGDGPGDGPEPGTRLTVVAGTGLGVLRHAPAGRRSLPPPVAGHAAEPTLLVLTKANRRSTVLRPAHLDYVGVKAFDAAGRVVGERRFIGLFPPEDRGGWVLDVPVVRRRARQVLRALGADPDSHDGTRVLQVLGSLPRAELLAAGPAELTAVARGALRLLGRRGVRVFARADPYGRFVSFVVLLANVEHGSAAVAVVEDALASATGGEAEPATVAVVGSGVTRLHVLVRSRGTTASTLPVPDLPALQSLLLHRLADWRTDLGSLLVARHPRRGDTLADRWAGAFPAAYREDVSPADAVADVFALDELVESDAPDPIRDGGSDRPQLTAALVPPSSPGEPWRFTLYRLGDELSLSSVLPVLSGLGVEVTDERPYRIAGREDLWVSTFRLVLAEPAAAAAPTLPWRFSESFLAAYGGVDDSDGLAALVVTAGLDRGAVGVLRAYLRWLRQTGWSFGDDYARGAVLAQPQVAAGLAELFEVRFDPDLVDRSAAEAGVAARLDAALDAVASLDHDRILRRLLAAIASTVRTNAFAAASGVPLVLVIDPAGVPELPQPLPWREVFVSGTEVEGVHLRFGPVARGGIRWSDRPEDFRTEVLGLAKAQTVKNTVIVPTGAKGGFVVRRPPPRTGDPAGDRDALAAAGRHAYALFIGGLLDVVDTLGPADAVPGGTRAVVHPPRTVCHDGEDSYLVVAADKGTATFSDLANSLALERGFWLGDAFASGGSAGYDHKAMGITARGAWESVRRHVAEIGLDADTDPLSVAGIGDMSGDVFGNAMLLSPHLRLVAAFDHRHVFLDPDPDPAASFAERRRLFGLARSSWADYDPAVVSAGGAVFARTAKSVTLSTRAAVVLGLSGDPRTAVGGAVVLTPDELVRAVLRAPVDLLFNGGIGTYVKATGESDAAAGDRANDAVRVDAPDVRARVIAEGGNLGMTQRGRVQYVRAGGRCNTDFVDNSAGVDTSDREVNLKILLGQQVAAGALDTAGRDRLLAAATAEVAAAVLEDNRSQNRASAIESAQGASLLRAHADLARRLESAGLLDRSLDAFPAEGELVALHRAGLALSVPELAVLTAWTKIWLRRVLTAALPVVAGDPSLTAVVTEYLPPSLRPRFAAGAPTHPLAAGIAATVVVNGVVDVAGPTCVPRLADELAVDVDQLLLAHTAARAVAHVDDHLAALAGARVPMAVAVEIAIVLRTLAERVTRWLVRHRPAPFDVVATVAEYAGGLDAVAEALPVLLTGAAAAAHRDRLEGWLTARVPPSVAAAAALARELVAGLAITDLAVATGRRVVEVAALHLEVAEVLGLDVLADRVLSLPRDDSWSTRARAALRDDLDRAQAAITERVLADAAPDPAPAAPPAPPGGAGGVGDPGTARTWAAAAVQGWLTRADRGAVGPVQRARRLLTDAVLDAARGADAAGVEGGEVGGAGVGAVAPTPSVDAVAAPELARLLVAVRAVSAVAGL